MINKQTKLIGIAVASSVAVYAAVRICGHAICKELAELKDELFLSEEDRHIKKLQERLAANIKSNSEAL